MFAKQAIVQRYAEKLQRSDDYLPFSRAQYRRILRHFRFAGTVLELGCGAAGFGRHILGAHVIGLDLTPALVSIARQHEPVVRADVQTLPFAAASFDSVFCGAILHHVTWMIRDVLAEIRRVLKPGGGVYLVEPNGSAFYRLIARQRAILLEVYDVPGERPVSKSELEGWFAAADFRLDAWTAGFAYTVHATQRFYRLKRGLMWVAAALFPNQILGVARPA